MSTEDLEVEKDLGLVKETWIIDSDDGRRKFESKMLLDSWSAEFRNLEFSYFFNILYCVTDQAHRAHEEYRN